MFNLGKDGAAVSEHVTLLGKDVSFKGVLMVGEHAVIKGTINAGTLVSRGKIKGTIIATEKVQLLKSAVLIGDVHAPSFAMDAEAHIQGQIDMGPSPWRDEPSHEIRHEDDWVASSTNQSARSHG